MNRFVLWVCWIYGISASVICMLSGFVWYLINRISKNWKFHLVFPSLNPSVDGFQNRFLLKQMTKKKF